MALSGRYVGDLVKELLAGEDITGQTCRYPPPCLSRVSLFLNEVACLVGEGTVTRVRSS